MSSWRFKTVTPNVKPTANGRSFKFHKTKSQTQDASKKTMCPTLKKKNSKCINAWKELKLLVNKAASKIPRAPAALSPVNRSSSTSKIPVTPHSKDRSPKTKLRVQQYSKLSTRLAESSSKLAQKTSLLTKKRTSKREVENEEKKKATSKKRGLKSKTNLRGKTRVAPSEQREETTAALTCSTTAATCMTSPINAEQPIDLAPKHQHDDGYETFARDPETGESTTEDCNARDPPVLVRDSEVWLEGRVSAEDSHLKSSSVSDLSNDDDSSSSCLELHQVCETFHSECSQALQTVDRIREEISFIRDSKPARKRRDKIPPWVRERYENSRKGRSARNQTSSKKTKTSSRLDSANQSTRLKQGIRDSPVDAAMPSGASNCVNTCDRQGRINTTDITDTEITEFFNSRGQTPINLSGSWMHQLQRIAEKDLEAPLQAELRTCLSRLAKLEFENRALKALVILKCGLPRHLGVHKFSRSGTPSTLAEDPVDCCTSEASFSEHEHFKVRRRETIDSAHEVFLTE